MNELSIVVLEEIGHRQERPWHPVKAQRWWVAQCLEQDLATQALTLADLIPEVVRLLEAYIVSTDTPFTGPRAPDILRDKFDEAVVKLAHIMWNGITINIRISA